MGAGYRQSHNLVMVERGFFCDKPTWLCLLWTVCKTALIYIVLFRSSWITLPVFGTVPVKEREYAYKEYQEVIEPILNQVAPYYALRVLVNESDFHYGEALGYCQCIGYVDIFQVDNFYTYDIHF